MHSWNRKLFLAINAQVGKKPWLDHVMYFSGQWLIVFVIWIAGLWMLVLRETPIMIISISLFAITALGIGLCTSQLIGLVMKHKRPIKDFPEVRTLITPLGNWKSFPSDHTLMVTITFLIAVLFAAPLWIMVSLGISALFVMVGRVYGGVHYPADIIGGLVLAGVSVWAAHGIFF